MTMTRSRKRATTVARAAIGAFVAVALTGCIKMDVDLALDGNDVSGSMIIGVERSFLDLAGVSADDFLTEIAPDDDFPEAAEVRPWEDGDYVGQEYVLENVDISEFDDGDSFAISYDEAAGRYEVSGSMDMTDMAGDPELDELPPGMMDSMFGAFDMSIAITFPGEVLEHNGTLEGSTVTWTPQFGESNEMHAVATDSGGSSGGGFPVWLAALLGVVVLAAVAAVVLLSRRNSDKPEAPQPEPDAAGV